MTCFLYISRGGCRFSASSPIYKKDVILNMKYEYYPKRRTEQERRELNEQILRLLQSKACEQAGVTDEDIFNRYKRSIGGT